MQRLSNYPVLSEVKRKTGHVHVKQVGGRWPRRARVVASQVLGRELTTNERVFHMDGVPDNDRPDNLAIIRFTGTEYYIAHSEPVYIPPLVIKDYKNTKTVTKEHKNTKTNELVTTRGAA